MGLLLVLLPISSITVASVNTGLGLVTISARLTVVMPLSKVLTVLVLSFLASGVVVIAVKVVVDVVVVGVMVVSVVVNLVVAMMVVDVDFTFGNLTVTFDK